MVTALLWVGLIGLIGNFIINFHKGWTHKGSDEELKDIARASSGGSNSFLLYIALSYLIEIASKV